MCIRDSHYCPVWIFSTCSSHAVQLLTPGILCQAVKREKGSRQPDNPDFFLEYFEVGIRCNKLCLPANRQTCGESIGQPEAVNNLQMRRSLSQFSIDGHNIQRHGPLKTQASLHSRWAFFLLHFV